MQLVAWGEKEFLRPGAVGKSICMAKFVAGCLIGPIFDSIYRSSAASMKLDNVIDLNYDGEMSGDAYFSIRQGLSLLRYSSSYS